MKFWLVVILPVVALGLVGVGVGWSVSIPAALIVVGALLWFDVTIGSLRK